MIDLVCPRCGADDSIEVIDSRTIGTRDTAQHIRRRRNCRECRLRFTTYEPIRDTDPAERKLYRAIEEYVKIRLGL